LIEIEVMDSGELKRIIDATLTGPRVKPGTSGVPRPSDSVSAPAHPDSRDADTPDHEPGNSSGTAG
jgi:hypothetical protein